jgi:hypothetical protein
MSRESSPSGIGNGDKEESQKFDLFPTHTAGGHASWCNHSGKKFGGFLKI